MGGAVRPFCPFSIRGHGWGTAHRGVSCSGFSFALVVAVALLATPALALTPAGTVITNVATATYDGGSVTSNAAEFTVAQIAGVQVAPSTGAATGLRGATVYYPVTVTNDGNGADTVALAAASTGGWSIAIYRDDNADGLHQSTEVTVISDTGTLLAGGKLACLVAVTVPAAAVGTDSETLTATSGFDPTRSATASYLTTASVPPPVANFTGSPISGPAPLTVSFTDTSTGAPTSWSWSFGDGGTSSSQNPSHQYIAAGSYTVSLTATNVGGSNTATKSGYITVTVAPPVANFTGSPTNGTAPLTVQFTDTSTGSPTSWSWSFGDGGTSSSQNPSHQYTAAGSYTVSLTATNVGGSNTATKSGYITVTVPPPVANFTGSPTNGTAPLTVQFTDTSTGTPTSWSWSFGDGGTSSSQNPSHQYTAAGSYTVSLTATNVGGSNTATKSGYVTVTVPPPVASFTGSPTNGTVPLTVEFTDTSTGSPTSWSWSFGDGGTSSLQNPSHQYTAAGSYTVRLTASNAGGSNTATKSGYITVTVPPPVANFTGSPTNGAAPLTVQFTDTSTGSPTSWSWSFGDGGTSSSQNPSHQYAAAGSYTVSLTATNAAGSNTATKSGYITVTVAPPVANFTGSPTDGVAPLTVQFTDTSTGSPTSWHWSFGDGQSTTAQNPSHAYTTAGSYTVSLTVSNAGGSNTATKSGYITVAAAPPVAGFSASPRNGMVPLTVQFTDTSTGTPTSWSWSFGDGATSSSQNPSHQYVVAGTYTVSLTVTNSGGSDTVTKSGHITVANALVLSLSADKSAPRPGDVVTYTISYSNTGQVTIPSIQIVGPIPLNTTYVAGSATKGGTYDGTKVTWSLGSLAPGASGTVTFRVTVN